MCKMESYQDNAAVRTDTASGGAMVVIPTVKGSAAREEQGSGWGKVGRRETSYLHRVSTLASEEVGGQLPPLWGKIASLSAPKVR